MVKTSALGLLARLQDCWECLLSLRRKHHAHRRTCGSLNKHGFAEKKIIVHFLYIRALRFIAFTRRQWFKTTKKNHHNSINERQALVAGY